MGCCDNMSCSKLNAPYITLSLLLRRPHQSLPTHEQSDFAVSGRRTRPLAASGGEDDLGYIWDITDGEVIAKLTGHSDSVASTAWSSDGEMVATGGMDGRVRVWRHVGKQDWKTWEFLTELQGPDEVMVRSIFIYSTSSKAQSSRS